MPESDSSAAARTFAANERPARTPGCHARDLDGEKVVYDPATHEVVVLNETAAFLYDLCDGGRSVADLLDALEERYDAPREVLAQDLGATLTELASKRLLS